MISLRKPKDRNGWLAVMFAAPLILLPAWSLWQGVESLSWAKADGVITYSTAKILTRTANVALKYRYSYGGRQYDGDQYRFQSFPSREGVPGSQVEAIQARHPVGEVLQVAVNPRNPSQSVLEAGPDSTDCLWLGFGALVALAGVGARREKPAQPELRMASNAEAQPNYRTAKWLAAIGALLLLFGVSELYEGWSSLAWPTVEGKVLYSVGHGGPESRTQLWYEYRVGGARFVADKYRNGGNGTPFDDVAFAAARRYPPGRAVTVHYKPSDPSTALLEPGVWYGNFVIPGLGLLMFGAAQIARMYAQAVVRLRRKS